MTVKARRFTIAGAAAALLAVFSCAVYLQAQDSALRPATPGISSRPAKNAGKATPGPSNASSAESSLTASEVQEKVSETIDGIKSGEISTAKHAEDFDNFIQETFIRISDCMTLGKQEMVLARESAKQEAVQTARDIVEKSKDVALEKGGKAIWESLPGLISPENLNALSESMSDSPGHLIEWSDRMKALSGHLKDAGRHPDDESEHTDDESGEGNDR